MSGRQWSGVAEDQVVRYADGSEQQVRTSMRDAVAWERKMKRSLLGGDPPGLTGALLLIWFALKRTGQQTGSDFEGWAATVDDFGTPTKDDDDDDVEGGFGDTDPTP